MSLGLGVIVEEAEEENYPNLVYAENVALREASQRLLKSRKKIVNASKKRREPLTSEKAVQSNNESSLSELDSSSVASASTEDDSSQSKDNVTAKGT